MKEEQCCACIYNANKVAEKAVVWRSLHAVSNGSFSLFAFWKGRGLAVKNTKNTFSLFHAALFTSKEAKGGLGREKKGREESMS